MRHALPCLSLTLLVGACSSSSAHREDSVQSTASPLSVPSGCPTIAFDVNAPSSSQIALTFDDGPEPEGTTLKVLDILEAKGVRATFFINTNNEINVLASSSARLAVQRMVGEGHQVGNHTVHHYHLGSASTDVRAEVSGVVDVLRDVAPDALAVRLVRAPFGEPYFGPQDVLTDVAPIVARYGVHIGWNIDSHDWSCSSATDQVACIKNHVLDPVDAGRSGVVLMHSTMATTVSALPGLIDALRARGKKFVRVEDLVVAKYGEPSRRLFRCVDDSECWAADVCGSDHHCGPRTTTPDAGPDDTAQPDSGEAGEPVAQGGTVEPNRQPFIPPTELDAGTAPVQLASTRPEAPAYGSCAHGTTGARTPWSLLLLVLLGALRYARLPVFFLRKPTTSSR